MRIKIPSEKHVSKKNKKVEPAVDRHGDDHEHRKTDEDEEPAPKRLKLQTEVFKSKSNKKVEIAGNKPGDNSNDEEAEMVDQLPAVHLEYLYPEPLIKLDYDLRLVLLNETGTNSDHDDNNANNIATSRDVNKLIDDEEANTQNAPNNNDNNISNKNDKVDNFH